MDLRRISQDPCSNQFVQNPYAAYQSWRDAPFFIWNEYDCIVSARFDVVDAILRDRRFGREAPEGFAPPIPEHLVKFYEFESRSMLEREPPTHTRLRKAVLRAFTPRRIETLRRDISTLCDSLLDQIGDDDFDLLPSFAEPIPVLTIARLIGVPDEMASQLLSWSHDMVAIYQANRSRVVEEHAVQAMLEFSDYISNLAQTRRQSPQNDLISELATIATQSDQLSFDELVTSVILLLNAGHEATVHAIANGVKTAIENNFIPNEDNIHAAIEEMLRIDPPLHMFMRYVLEDMGYFGVRFKKGEQIGLLLGAANHDPARFETPEKFIPQRINNKHTSFGAGVHFCLGAPLARLEMEMALSTLFERFPKLRFSSSTPKAPHYADRYHFHGLENLWLSPL